MNDGEWEYSGEERLQAAGISEIRILHRQINNHTATRVAHCDICDIEKK